MIPEPDLNVTAASYFGRLGNTGQMPLKYGNNYTSCEKWDR